MLLRNSNFKARERFTEPAEQSDRIVFHPFPTRVQAIEETGRGCRLQLDEAGEMKQLDVAKLFIRIGVEPQYPEFTPMPETDDRGFIRVDRQQRTTESGLFAIGDVTDTPLRAVCTSTGNGAIAANTVARQLDYIGR
jgi:thioredoxin reductase (NADPH)